MLCCLMLQGCHMIKFTYQICHFSCVSCGVSTLSAKDCVLTFSSTWVQESNLSCKQDPAKSQAVTCLKQEQFFRIVLLLYTGREGAAKSGHDDEGEARPPLCCRVQHAPAAGAHGGGGSTSSTAQQGCPADYSLYTGSNGLPSMPPLSCRKSSSFAL